MKKLLLSFLANKKKLLLSVIAFVAAGAWAMGYISREQYELVLGLTVGTHLAASAQEPKP